MNSLSDVRPLMLKTLKGIFADLPAQFTRIEYYIKCAELGYSEAWSRKYLHLFLDEKYVMPVAKKKGFYRINPQVLKKQKREIIK